MSMLPVQEKMNLKRGRINWRSKRLRIFTSNPGHIIN